MKNKYNFKITEVLKVTLTKKTVKNPETVYFFSEPNIVLKSSDLSLQLSLSKQQIRNKIQAWISQGSNWTISKTDAHFIKIAKYVPLRGSSYIQLPVELRNSKKGLVNLKNNDDKCFLWCHIRYLNPQIKDPQRIKKSDRGMVSQLNYDGVEFPVSSKDCNKIERQNGNETDLHYKVVNMIREFYPDSLLIPGLGENQESSVKRIDSARKGYMKGQPDLMITNYHKDLKGLCIEFKSPTNRYFISEEQKNMKR